MPSWLISAVLHMIGLIILALLVLETVEKPAEEVILASVDLQREEMPTEFEIQSVIDPLERMEHVALPMPEETGMIELGEIADDVKVATESSVGLPALRTSMVEIGDLLGSDGQGFAQSGTDVGGAEFFGVKSSGNRFVFVVDGSNSMGRNDKWNQCRKELLNAVRKLSPRQRFYVFLFSRRSHRMFGRDETSSLVRANAENIDKLRQWLEYDYELQGGTVPMDGLREALEEMQPDAIYLLSDGQFTDDGRSERYLLDYARNENDQVMFETGDRYRVYVHTIAFHSRRGQVVLKRIADAFGGTFRFVPGR